VCSENKFLLNDNLKEEWGHAGFTMTDWGCCKDKGKALAAGLDLQMADAEGLVEKVRRVMAQLPDDAVINLWEYASAAGLTPLSAEEVDYIIKEIEK
jgi:beta-glucosidase-like glycosyl hydrolase